MTSPDQNQRVEESAVAIQSARDTNINNGLSIGQMKEIIEALSDQIPKYTAIAANIVEERLKEFEGRIVSRFEDDKALNREAFKDPDFQYLLIESQKSFARSGDADALRLLEELVAERSKAKSATRQALTINRAVEITPLLTKEEIAHIAACFAVRYVKLKCANDIDAIGRLYDEVLEPFIDNLSTDTQSVQYIESLGCGSTSIGSTAFLDALFAEHPQLRRSGRKAADIVIEALPHFEQLAAAGIFQKHGDTFVSNESDFLRFKSAAINAGFAFDDAQLSSYFGSVSSTQNRTDEELLTKLSETMPRVKEFASIWNEGRLKHLNLTLVGLAIGYISVKNFAPLPSIDIWVS